MNTTECELAAIEGALREHEQQQIFREARFADLTAQIVARQVDGSIDGWKHYLHGELRRLEFSDKEILAGIEVAKLDVWACEPAARKGR